MFIVLTAVALVIARRRPIVLVADAALMAAIGLYVAVSGGGAWRRALPQPAPVGAFRVIGVMIVATGIGIPSMFLLRAGLSAEPALFGSRLCLVWCSRGVSPRCIFGTGRGERGTANLCVASVIAS